MPGPPPGGEQNMIWYKSYINLSPIPASRCRSLLRTLGEGPRASVPVEWPFGPVANDTGRDAYWGAQTERPFGPVVTAPLVVVHRLKHVRYVNGVPFPYCVSGANATTLFLCDFLRQGKAGQTGRRKQRCDLSTCHLSPSSNLWE